MHELYIMYSSKTSLILLTFYYFYFIISVMARMSANSFDTLSTPYQVLRIDEIPISITLHQLTRRISPFSRHIIGCARTADYVSKRKGTTIYFICTNVSDAVFLESQHIDFVGDGRDPQSLTIVDSIVARATLVDLNFATAFEGIPVTIYLRGLQRYNYREGTTEYLSSLIAHFELRGAVTSVRLNYDTVRKSSRSDGFVSYLNQRDARDMAGEVEPVHHSIFSQQITAVLSTNVPLIVQLPNAFVLDRGRTDWSNAIADINQLMIRHPAPFVHPRIRGPDEPSGDVPIVNANVPVDPPVAPPTASSTDTVSSSVKSRLATQRPIASTAPVPSAEPTVSEQPSTSTQSSEPQTSSKEERLRRLSTEAVWNLKDATTGPFYYVFESDDEELYVPGTNPNAIVRVPEQEPPTPVSEPVAQVNDSNMEWEDEGGLIINEEVHLSDDDCRAI